MWSALASPRRREILRILWTSEHAAGEVHRRLGDVTFGAVSQQLRALEEAGLVSSRREGRKRLYIARRQALGSLRSELESLWSSALYRLKLEAELEESRRGPRARRRTARRK